MSNKGLFLTGICLFILSVAVVILFAGSAEIELDIGMPKYLHLKGARSISMFCVTANQSLFAVYMFTDLI